jgi:hypothetical protein
MRPDDKHDDEQDEPVGYGRPPKRTQFQKGKSGNPHGRPKGTLNLATIIARTIMEPVVITEHGQKKTITKLEAAAKQLMNKAASGELRASAQLVALVQWMEHQMDAHEPAPDLLPEADQRVRDRMLRQLIRQAQQGGAPHGSDIDPA